MGGRLLLAVLAGVAAELAGLGLIGAAAWMITRAAERPPLAALSVAIVAVRAFATSRGVFRYGERLAGHDVALRAQATTRERLYQALIPAGPLPRGGADLLSSMVDDTDAVQDLLVRCLLPALAGLVTGAAAVVLGAFLLPAAALALLAGLLVAGVLLPAATRPRPARGLWCRASPWRPSRSSPRRRGPARWRRRCSP
jgi:ATP-binding cassette subfamily C protein/ATP-binding cassette subfamily C protein CydC